MCLLESAIYTKMLVNTSDGHAEAPVSGCIRITSVSFNISTAGLSCSFVFLFCIPFYYLLCGCVHLCVHVSMHVCICTVAQRGERKVTDTSEMEL